MQDLNEGVAELPYLSLLESNIFEQCENFRDYFGYSILKELNTGNTIKKQRKSVFSGRFLYVFMQFQDIKSHEDKSEIHCDLGFSEVAEARVSVIVFELSENRLRFQRPSLQLLLICRKGKPDLCFSLFPDIA